VRRLDVYAPVQEDLRVCTEGGATVTIVFWAILTLLLSAELWSYARAPTRRERLRVDTSLGQRMAIFVNMTFHAIPCLDVHIDAMDVAGAWFF
ncbi:unnamed protein product, partial [Phaeothamnion confervicola]